MTDERVAIVTGAGRGIGEAVALALARDGFRLVLAARTVSQLDDVAAAVHALGTTAQVVPADVAQAGDADRIAGTALDVFGRIDVLVNVAGVYGPIGPTWEVDLDAWIDALQVNVVGTLRCCRAVLPSMIERGQGRIINFSGGGATSPLPRFSAYATSKAAVVRLTETLAEEVAEHGIQVNAVAPGAVDTQLQDEVLAAGPLAGGLYERILQLRESGVGGVPRELAADLVAFLASERAGRLTGKLVAAPYDGWKDWDDDRIEALMALPWLTLRRLDQATMGPFASELGAD